MRLHYHGRRRNVRAEVEETPFGHRTELAEILLERDRARDALPLVEADAKLRRDPGTLYVLAWAQLANGRAKDARTSIREAMKWGYRDARLYRLAARIEDKLGGISRARLYEDFANTVEGK